MNFSNITIGGHLGADPEVRNTANGKMVTSFNVCVNTGYGQSKKASWFKVILWGENWQQGIVPYLKKGKPVIVNGECSIATKEYTDKMGNVKNMTAVEINAREVKLVGGNNEQKPQQATTPQQSTLDDEVPF